MNSIKELCSDNTVTAAVKTDGSVYAWGTADFLGDGDGFTTVPMPVVAINGASAVMSTLGTGDTSNSWLLSNFSASELIAPTATDTSDPDGDGIPNLVEYALGTDPRTRSSSVLPSIRVDTIAGSAQSESGSSSQVQVFSTPTVDLTSGKHYLAYTVNRSGGIRQDIDYIVEVSDDLVHWRSGEPDTVTVLDTAEVLEVYSTASLDDVPRSSCG
jgi:hypothetical protein